MTVLAAADSDQPNSPDWTTSYKIVAGDDQGMFSVSSVAHKLDGIITTVKVHVSYVNNKFVPFSNRFQSYNLVIFSSKTTLQPLDFEKQCEHLLLVTVENDVPFSTPLLTSTATVKVSVKDENEAPVFQPRERKISRPEDLTAGRGVVMYREKTDCLVSFKLNETQTCPYLHAYTQTHTETHNQTHITQTQTHTTHTLTHSSPSPGHTLTF